MSIGKESWDVAIIGGGPAGLMAAARAAERGRKTILLDKNREPGVKILLSGGTRCNLTHATDARGIVEAFGPNGRFLHSALASLGPQQVVDLFESEGVPTKIEPGGKVFPASDQAADVRNAMLRRVKRSGCTLAMGETVVEIHSSFSPDVHVGKSTAWTRRLNEDGSNHYFQLATTQRMIEAEKVVLATGGQSYPACGTTGDGYCWAAALGHRIVPPHTALVPITSHAPWVLELQGITLPDVTVKVVDPIQTSGAGIPACLGTDKNVCPTKGSLASSRGSMLFTHFGVSGPVVLDVSHAVSGHPQPTTLLLRCDLMPDFSEVQLDKELSRRITTAGKRRLASLLDDWLPHRVGETLVALVAEKGSGTFCAKHPEGRSGKRLLTPFPLDLPVAEFSKTQRRRLVQSIKRLDIPVAGTMGFRKAELTAGGVSLAEVDSRTMQSRIVPDLYFAGELLDLNGPVGGYNFQAAFSTGWLAGESV